jgi:hypothetical protein
MTILINRINSFIKQDQTLLACLMFLIISLFLPFQLYSPIGITITHFSVYSTFLLICYKKGFKAILSNLDTVEKVFITFLFTILVVFLFSYRTPNWMRFLAELENQIQAIAFVFIIINTRELVLKYKNMIYKTILCSSVVFSLYSISTLFLISTTIQEFFLRWPLQESVWSQCIKFGRFPGFFEFPLLSGVALSITILLLRPFLENKLLAQTFTFIIIFTAGIISTSKAFYLFLCILLFLDLYYFLFFKKYQQLALTITQIVASLTAVIISGKTVFLQSIMLMPGDTPFSLINNITAVATGGRLGTLGDYNLLRLSYIQSEKNTAIYDSLFSMMSQFGGWLSVSISYLFLLTLLCLGIKKSKLSYLEPIAVVILLIFWSIGGPILYMNSIGPLTVLVILTILPDKKSIPAL